MLITTQSPCAVVAWCLLYVGRLVAWCALVALALGYRKCYKCFLMGV
ncbi:hypothetical protein [Campylobacter magnus]|nr:hypothetical protein [Campylobacter magnus]MDD0855390.1 hypothetical protein [Campylobacter magnus]